MTIQKTLIILTAIITANSVNAQNTVSAKLYFPREISEKEPLEIKLEIHKPEKLTSYATFKQKIPEGFNISPENTADAKITFENNILTLSWIRLPDRNTVNAKYKIINNRAKPGTYNLGGNFSYITNNKKGEINIKNKTFTLIPRKTNTPENNNIKCIRKKIPQNNKTLTIKININGLENIPCIITEEIPPGYKIKTHNEEQTATKINNRIIQFYCNKTNKNQQNKIITYTLIPENKNLNTTPLIYGKLSFIKKNKIINIPVTDSK
ncbi:MAG: hypothetical protein GXO50_10430 [Chlorobi bacterium]|nr:hypothetical protein [Chlorobiota bacterium]